MATGKPKNREIRNLVPSMSTLENIEEESSRARVLASSIEQQHRMAFARSMVFGAVKAYWQRLHDMSDIRGTLRKPPFDFENIPVSAEAGELAGKIGGAAADLDAIDAGYAIGVFYTTMMPGGVRAQHGAYYTPPALCDGLLDMAEDAGVDWRTARILDPACGGGAFLSPVARRMANALRNCDAGIALTSIERRLRGFELDPFAAWMSQVFLDVTLAVLCNRAGMRLAPVVRVCNSLEQKADGEGFHLVVGNPPYGRVRLPTELREKFRRSLFGHANLYGVFTDLALRFARDDGVIAYVTPTSFLAGEYFKALRGLLGREAPPAGIDFVEERKGVFADVLQETLLATYKRGAKSRKGKVHFLSPGRDGSVVRTAAGAFSLPEDAGRPWLMPRTEKQDALLRRVDELPYRLADYGYTVSTGPLVWNRHKSGLRDRPGAGRYPLIWAESVRPEGMFSFRAEKRNHKPYFEPKAKERWVVTAFPCVLLQRTTAKEQCRRLIAAELPASFLKEHGAVVIENHLNMIKPQNGTPKVAPTALAVLLNSDTVDQIFRCMNGSVAVSAYELEALPLPLPEHMAEIERLVDERANRETLERAVERLYGHGAG